MNYLGLILMLLLCTPAWAVLCPPSSSDDGQSTFYSSFECHQGLVVLEKEFHRPSGKMTGEKKYQGEQLVQEDVWSVDGVHTYRALFNYLDQLHFIKTVYRPNDGMSLVSKEQYLGLSDSDEDKILQKEWKYARSGKLQAVHHYAAEDLEQFITRPRRVEMVNSQGLVDRYFDLEYFEVPETTQHIRKVRSYRLDGTLIGQFLEDQDLDIERLIEENNTSSEAERKLKVFRDTSRRPVMVVDTGFDISHPELTHKLWNNPKDPMDGIDNDGNGFIDDVFGWQHQNDPALGLALSRNNINETLFITHFPYPVSHGTHVAFLALKDIENFGLIGIAGDVAFVDLLKHVSKMIGETKTQFVNMSFSISYPEHPQAPGRDSYDFLEKIFKDHPQTLFVVAAGNAAGVDLDAEGVRDYPASYAYDNMLVVGALNTSEMDYNKRADYQVAGFSKYGHKTVDIFAPGQQIVAAEVGGGKIALNGTSMAAPIVTNLALKMSTLNPNLTPMQIKEIMMKTAYIPKVRLPCVSGGMIDPKAALEMAKSYISE